MSAERGLYTTIDRQLLEMGFSTRLVAADLIALRTFGHTMAGGVVVR
jgi:hypothetical protein